MLVDEGVPNLYSISEDLLAILGRVVVPAPKKWQYIDLSTGPTAGVTIKDDFIRREHQYNPSRGPKRLFISSVRNQDGPEMMFKTSKKIEVNDEFQEPYFVVENVAEKVLIKWSARETLRDTAERLLIGTDGLLVDLSMEFVVPRLAVSLVATKPHRVDREALEKQSNVSFVQQVFLGAKLQGKLAKFKTAEEIAADSKKGSKKETAADPKKKPKKPKKSSKPGPPIPFNWEIKTIIGDIPFQTVTNMEISSIVKLLESYYTETRSSPSSWKPIWIRSQTSSNFLSLLPPVIEEYPLLIHAGKTKESSFEFKSRSREVALIREAEKEGLRLTGDEFTAYLGQRGYACSCLCTNLHAVIPLVSNSNPSKCSRCDETSNYSYRCGICNEAGNLCGYCLTSEFGYCPERHLLEFNRLKEDFFIECDNCHKKPRKFESKCSSGGNHFHQRLCSLCFGEYFYPKIVKNLEPTPFEYNISVTGRVKMINAIKEQAEEFIQTYLAINKSIKLFEITETPDFCEFRFTLTRHENIPPFKKVLDLMLLTDHNTEINVDVVEIVSLGEECAGEIQQWLQKLNIN
jgi:hypothetical protein